MRIQTPDNKNIPSFKTYLGLELQERVLHAKNKGMLSQEQLKNLAKIEDNGSNTVLDITKKIIIRKFGNKKSSVEIKRILSLKNITDTIEIEDLSHIFHHIPTTGQISFNIRKLLNIFSDNYDLPGKIQQACKKAEDL